MYLHLTDLLNIELFWCLTECKQNLHLYKTELAELELLEIEMFFTIKLRNYAKLNCLK